MENSPRRLLVERSQAGSLPAEISELMDIPHLGNGPSTLLQHPEAELEGRARSSALVKAFILYALENQTLGYGAATYVLKFGLYI